jgi:hypothetical protein
MYAFRTTLAALLICGSFVSLLRAQYVHLHEHKGEVVGITFQGNSKWLVAQEDPESRFHAYPHLEEVALLNHDVSHEAMQYIVGLKTVKYLTVGAAPESLGIEDRTFALVGNMSQLESLQFCKPRLTDTDLKPLTKLKCLTHLEIEGTNMAIPPFAIDPDSYRLTDAAAIHFAAMETLQSLTIRTDENFTDALIEKLAALPKLRHLEIGSQQFTDKALGILGVEYGLRTLTINSQHFTDAGVKALCHAGELEELNVQSPKLTAKSIAHVKALKKLRSLELPIERLEDDTMSTLAEMTSLERLLLRHVPITDVELIKLKNHPSLTTLFLENSDLSIYSLETFKSMPKLEYVNLGWDAKESPLQQRLNAYLKAKAAKTEMHPTSP